MKQVLFFLLLLGGVAEAQVSDVEVPTIVIDTSESAKGAADDEAIDLANIVQSAAKGVTTVQEAPAIVTVVTSDEIRERQFQTLDEIVETVPGWSQSTIANGMLVTPLVRGQVQAVQYLHDGLSLFDGMVNLPTINRVQPMETIKRVELITGPGGVLWGANSLLGIVNVITKDAEDVEGIEMGGSIGDGKGDRQTARAYVMAGDSDLFDNGKVKGFVHGSFETWQGQITDMPLMLFHNPLPQPNSTNVYGPLSSGVPKQSMAINVDGKLTYGKFVLRGQFQTGHFYKPNAFAGNPVRYGDEDPRWDGITFADEFDPKSTAHQNSWDTFDRYLVGEYRDRLAHDKAGITVRGYFQQFVRGFHQLQVLAPNPTIVGGVAFDLDLSSYRTGGSLEGDVDLKPFRLLYGAEAFHEWRPDNTTTSRGGPGNQADFLAPIDLTRLPILCPRIYDSTKMAIVPVDGCPLTFAYVSSRTVFSGYANGQLRPNKKLILDGGARVSVAPDELGTVGYPVNVTAGGTLVYNFLRNWHFKLNYTQGFRPPVFNNTSGNGEAIAIGGDPNLQVETSDATQAEINARIFKGERRIRELSFRADVSYTRLQKFIQVQTGSYSNTGERGLTSAEFLGKLYIQGGHRFELGYTFLRAATADRGLLKSLPEHWFNLASIFNLVPNKLTAMTNLKIVGSMEDPNRLIEYRDFKYDAMGNPVDSMGAAGAVNVLATDLVMDRLPPVADLQLGMTYTPTPKLTVRATVYNALVQQKYYPDAFLDYEPHLEYMANPAPSFRAYLSAMYQY